MDFINYSTQVADGWWQRDSFLKKWWSLYRTDNRWAPFLYRKLYRNIVCADAPHLARQNPLFITMQAFPQSKRKREIDSPTLSASAFEQTIAASLLLTSPTDEKETLHAALLHCINHEETIERFFGVLLEKMFELQKFRLIAPLALSSHDTRTGVLCSHFNRISPLHTPYNPPYVAELFELVMNPYLEMRLYQAEIPSTIPTPETTTQIIPIAPKRLAGDLLPLFQCAYFDHPEFAPPDEIETAYLLDSWNISPLTALVALIDQSPVGFVLLQNDLGKALHRAKGGRNLFWHRWLLWQSHKPTDAGRLLSGGVLPEWRRQGIARQLWQAALKFGIENGWRSMGIGPVIKGSDAARFLETMGATAEQTYRLYSSEE